MNTTTILWLGLLLALLPALEQSMRASSWPAWLKVPALYRGIAIAIVGAATGALGSVLQDGLTWQQGIAAGLAVAVPAILKLIFHVEVVPTKSRPSTLILTERDAIVVEGQSNAPGHRTPKPGIPPTAALLVLGLVGLGQVACVASLEESRPTSPVRHISIAGVPLQAGERPAECTSINSRRTTWGIVQDSATGVTVAAATGGVLDLALKGRSEQARLDWAMGLGIATAVSGTVYGVASRQFSQADSEWVSRGCGQ